MSGKDLLSQEEIDALLHGVGGEDEEDEAAYFDDGQPRAFNFHSQDRIVRGSMPTLDMINERFVREFRISLFHLLRRKAEVTDKGVKTIKFGEYLQSLLLPTSINITNVHPLRGSALFVLDPRLIFKLVDNFFGGDGRYYSKVEGRDFTPTEQSLTRTLLQSVYKDLKTAWKPVLQLDLEHVNTEINPQFANIITPTEVVVVASFDIELEGGGGELHICYPYSMLEPIREQLATGFQSDSTRADDRWTKTLQHDLESAKIALTADFLKAELTLKELLDMEPGDILSIDLPEQVTLFAENIPLFKCSFGQADEHYAVKIKALIRTAQEFT